MENEMRVDARNFRRILRLELENGSKENVIEAIRILEKRDDVLVAEPSFIEFPQTVNPNDPRRNQQWGLDRIGAPSAWGITTGSSAVRVGIIDTGIQANHPDLINRVNTSLSRDFTIPYPYIPTSVIDTNGHGTHVAGIVGAEGNNGVGITGVCWDVELIALRAGVNSFPLENIKKAVIFATNNNIHILNYSGGGTTPSTTRMLAIKAFPGLFVAAAGNGPTNSFDGINTDYNPFFPAGYRVNTITGERLSNVISVAATMNNNDSPTHTFLDHTLCFIGGMFLCIIGVTCRTITQLSNYGRTTVCLFAPGRNIYSTLRNGGYGNKSGSSMSAPMVAGVVAFKKHEIKKVDIICTDCYVDN